MSTRTLFAVAAIAALEFAGSAQASPARLPTTEAEQISVRVPVSDLDLRKLADAKIALQRIHHAAVVICGEEPLYTGLARYARFQGCVKTTVRNAVSLPSTQIASDPNAGSRLLDLALAANP